MLQCIDGVTELSAQNIASQFTSVKVLVSALRDTRKPQVERQLLLQDLFAGKGRKPKLSRKVYNIFASDKEDDPINSDDDIGDKGDGDGN